MQDLSVRRLLTLLLAPSTQRFINVVIVVTLQLCLLLMLGVAVSNSVAQASGTLIWLAPAGVAIGPIVSIAFRLRAVRHKTPAIRRLLGGAAFLGAAALSLSTGRADAVAGALGVLSGVGWGIWNVEQWRLRDVEEADARARLLTEQRHAELLHEIRRLNSVPSPSTGSCVCGASSPHPGT